MCTTSVLLCTHDSRKMLPLAIESYLQQDYPSLELVVVDDGSDPIYDMVKDLPGLHYRWLPAENLSQKRNAGIAAARGEFIAHFDSDDWSGPRRISEQVEKLTQENAKVVGYSKAFWFDVRKNISCYASCGLWGAALTYERQWALGHPWDETKVSCEDGWFLKPAIESGVAVEMDGGDNFVALQHNGNAERPFRQSGWAIVGNEQLPKGFVNALWRSNVKVESRATA